MVAARRHKEAYEDAQPAWLLRLRGRDYGPYQLEGLQELVADGQLSPGSLLVSTADEQECRAEDIPGLFGPRGATGALADAIRLKRQSSELPQSGDIRSSGVFSPADRDALLAASAALDQEIAAHREARFMARPPRRRLLLVILLATTALWASLIVLGLQ